MNYVRKVYNCSMEYKFSNPEEYFRKIKNLSNNIVFMEQEVKQFKR